MLFPQPKLKQIRRMASAMQQEQMNKLQKGNHFKDAMKRAALEYSAEMKKIGVNGKCVGSKHDRYRMKCILQTEVEED